LAILDLRKEWVAHSMLDIFLLTCLEIELSKFGAFGFRESQEIKMVDIFDEIQNNRVLTSRVSDMIPPELNGSMMVGEGLVSVVKP